MKSNTVLIESGVVYSIGADIDVWLVAVGADGVKNISRVENKLTRGQMLKKLADGRWGSEA